MTNLNTILKSFGQGFILFGARLSLIINVMLLSVVYLIGIGLTNLVAKLTGKKFLSTKLSKTSKTYWKNVDTKRPPLERFYRQF